MTATSYRRQLSPPSHRLPPTRRFQETRRDYFLVAALLSGCCEVAGVASLVHAYNIAEATLTSTSEFAWFWLGMLLIELPLAGIIARRATPNVMRTALLVFYGLVSYIPKLLRNPTGPIYHDEFAHWRATYEILSTGKLFQPNPIISIIARYPGLHAATASLVHATGLTIWQAGTILLVTFHVTLVLGIAGLAQALGFNNRTAALIAILYGLNSSFLYFDTQYAYESMAITLVVWTLVAFVRAIRSSPGEERAVWSVLTLLFSAGTVITHHLLTFTLVQIMVLVSLVVSVPWLARGKGPPRGGRRKRGTTDDLDGDGWPRGWARDSGLPGGSRSGWGRAAVTAWGLSLGTALMAGAWFRFLAPATWSYLSPFLGEGLSQLMQAAHGSGGTRQLFGASLSPGWEQKSAYLVPLVALGLALGGLISIQARMRDGRLPRGSRRALLVAFALLGLIYFPSTLFILSPSGAEGARRSWAFTWIGLCMLAGPVVVWLLDWVGRRRHQWDRIGLRFGLLGLLGAVLVGGTAAGLDASYRLPGPFLYGSDARSITPELVGTSTWFTARFGAGNNVVTDRYTGLVFSSSGLQNATSPFSGLPFYNLYLARPGTQIEPPYLLPRLKRADYTYMIVDGNMAYDLPQLGVYFTSADPVGLRPQGGKPIFSGRLSKFGTFEWMIRVFQSDTYSVYRLDLPPVKPGYQHQPPTSRGRPLRGNFVVTP